MDFLYKDIEIKVSFWFAFGICFCLCIVESTVLRYAVLFSLLHECGHLCTHYICHTKPREIRFSLLGMTIVETEDASLSYKAERFIAFGGPFVNFIFFTAFLLCFYFTKSEKTLTIAFINFFIFAFNSLPIFTLDGGRILESFLLEYIVDLERALRLEKLISFVCTLCLFFVGFYVLIHSHTNFFLLLLSIYLFLVLFKNT